MAGEFADRGVSGDLPVAERPEASRLMAMCERGQAELVAVVALDRFGRDVVETLIAQRDLERAGVGFVSIEGGLDTRDGMGRMNLQLRAVIAEEEKRTHPGAHRRRAAGAGAEGLLARRPAAAGLPAGALGGWASTASHRRGPRPACSGARQRWSWTTRLSTWEAAQTLNALGLTPRRTTRWTHNHLRRVLLSPTLGGQWAYKPKQGEPIAIAIPAILSPSATPLFWTPSEPPAPGRVRAASSSNCRGCWWRPAGPLHGVSRRRESGTTSFYRCNNARPEAGPKCGDPWLSAPQVEGAVWGEGVPRCCRANGCWRWPTPTSGLASAAGTERDQLATLDAKLAHAWRRLEYTAPRTPCGRGWTRR